MKRVITQILGQNLSRPRIKPEAKFRLRLDSLEARDMQGSLLDGMFHGLIGGLMADPLIAMQHVVGSHALSGVKPPAPQAAAATKSVKNHHELPSHSGLGNTGKETSNASNSQFQNYGVTATSLLSPGDIGSTVSPIPVPSTSVNPSSGSSSSGVSEGGGFTRPASESGSAQSGSGSPDSTTGITNDLSSATSAPTDAGSNSGGSPGVARTSVVSTLVAAPNSTTSGSSSSTSSQPTVLTTPSNTVIAETPSKSAAAPNTSLISSSPAPFYAVGTDAGVTTKVRVYDATNGSLKGTITPFSNTFQGGARVAISDVTGDGTADLIVAQGAGGTNLVKVYDGSTLSQLSGTLGSFQAFTTTAANGEYVAAGDVTGDGKADIVVGSDGTGTPTVKVFDGSTGSLLTTRNLSTMNIAGGVRVGAGDVNGDGRADVVAAGGTGGSSRVAVWDGATGAEIQNFFAFNSNFAGGVNLSVGDVNNDGYADIITGQATGGSRVNIYNGHDNSSLGSYEAFPGSTIGVRVGAVDSNQDGPQEVIAAQAVGGGKVDVRNVIPNTTLLATNPFGTTFTSGLFAAGDARPAGSTVTPFVIPAVFSITAASGGIEGGTASFTITRTGNTGISASFGAAWGGSATNGTDYTASINTTFAANQLTEVVTVNLATDGQFEGPESISLTLSPSGALSAVGTPSSLAVTLIDADAPISSPPGSGSSSGSPTGGGLTPTTPTNPLAGSSGGGDVSSDGVRYSDGAATETYSELWSGGFGQAWGLGRSWTNILGYEGASFDGNSTVSQETPYLRTDGTHVLVVTGGTDAEFFDLSGGVYVPRFYSQNSLTQNTTNKEFTLVTSDGSKLIFSNFDASLATYQKGRMKSVTDANGNVTQITSSTTDGKPSEVQRSSTVGSTTTVESYLYAYLATGSNAGKIDTVTERRQVNGGSWTTVRTAQYSYYDGTTSNGTLGDIKTAVVKDASSNVLDSKYYRYYTSASATGYAGALKFALSDASYQRLSAWATANSTTVDAATDSQVSPFADSFYTYDSTRRVTTHTRGGANGISSTTFAYTTSTFADGYNSWRTKTVETLADGTVNTVYTNFAGQTILMVTQPSGSSNKWCTYHRFDNSGRVIMTALPSAISGYDDTFADLLNNQSGDYQYLRNSQGLIQTTTYGSSTTATSTTPGNVNGYQYQSFLQLGETGSTVLQQTLLYVSRTDGLITVYPLASATKYRNTNGTGGETTSNSYVYFTGTIQPQQVTVTLPTVTTTQNGSNTAESGVSVMDDRGREIWNKDAAGFLTYKAYDDVTGGLTKIIRDVDTTQTSTFANLPSGWTTPSGGGLQQTTTFELDDQGRTTKTTDPNGNITYAVYNDATHETRVYPGWDSTTNTPTGPTMVTREDRSRSYVETLTMTATPTVSGGRPTGTETISGVQTLVRSILNSAGQVVAKDQYFNLSGVTYSQSSATLGTANTNYYRTSYAYDGLNRLLRTQSPSGTIYRTVFDGLGRESSKWVGTDDTPTSGTWSPTNTTGTDLVKLSDNTYDSGGIGDSNLTETISYPGGGAANRVTDYSYDWRDRSIATKSGVETSESTSVNRPISYVEYDNLNNVISQETYDGDAVGITTDANSDGVPDRPSSSLLRSKSTTAYDEQNRAYQQKTFSVDPSSGSVSTNALTTNTWYDSRQNVVKKSSPGGLVTKSVFDSLNRATTSYQTDGGGDSAYADAFTVTGDAVLSQMETTYDIGGRTLLVTDRERFHDETGTGALGTPTTGVKARVSYSATYYDKANRTTDTVNVGTNGGSTYTRPSTVPSRSDTVLVSSTGYNSAGWAETTTDPRGIVGKQYYDNMGRVTKSIDNYVDGVVSDSDDKTIEYTYDPSGNKATLRADLTGGGYQETKWVYGITSPVVSNDVLKETRYPDPSTGAASSTDKESLTYNQLGQVLTRTDRIGTVHTYAYDTLGRRVSDTVSTLGTGVDGSVRRVETAYDGQGNPYLITSYDATTSGSVVNQIQRAYNGLGQMTQEWQATSGAVNTGTTPSVQYGYSFAPSGTTNHSRLTSIAYPNGRVLTYNYSTGLADNISRLSSITDGATTLESYDYLGLGTVVRRGHTQTGVDQTYVKLTGESDGAAGDKYIGLDNFGRVVDQRWTTSGGTTADRFGYSYDRDSNRLYKENLVSASNSELYSYDNLNQLSSFQRGTLNGTKTGLTGSSSRSQSWDFDALGNFDSQTTDGTTQSRTANKQNEITSISGATTPTYDANGNLTKDETGRTFTYDAWNRLATVKDSGGTLLATYKWDGLGHRVREIRGSTTTDLYYSDQWQVLEERVGGVAKFSYAWSPVYVDAMIARDRDTDANGTLDERLYAVQDANFNVTALINTSGTIVERYQFDPFGKFSVLDGSWATRGSSSYGWNYLHQGGRWDADGGVYSFRNRELSPTLGRWTSNDPIKFESRTTNFYSDRFNNPINVFDTSGLDGWSWSGAWGGLTSGAILGTVTGAALGAPAGGIGALPGAIVGGILGAGVGFIGGGWSGSLGAEALSGCSDAESWKLELATGLVVGIGAGILAPLAYGYLVPGGLLGMGRWITAANGGNGLVQVTSWAESGVIPDLIGTRFVQLGGPSYLNYLWTGLIGGKILPIARFPFFTYQKGNYPSNNFITEFVDPSRLSWLSGTEFWKFIIGQHMLN